MFKNLGSKLAFLLGSVAVVANTAFAQDDGVVVTAIKAAATSATTDFGAIISAITPVAFIIVVALVGIGAAIKLFRKGG